MSVFGKLKALITRCMVSTVDDSNDLQLMKVTGNSGEEIDGERLQPYGLSANPPVDSEGLVAFSSADHEQAFVFVVDSGAWRIKGLKSGEVALYSKHGQSILLKENGDVATTMTGLATFGNGTDFVALASKIDQLLTALTTTVAPGGVAVITPTPGATCPVAAAIYASMLAAFGSGTSDVGSTNLKAD